jgi:glycine/D-amino acid oxidase-like deaminating enzyme
MQTGQDHTGSYYAATANDAVNGPQLKGRISSDVCVIGAGFTGIATALTLAERGFDVCVLEANKVGWGASGRNGGQMIGGMSGERRMLKECGRDFSDALWEMRWAGHDIIRRRVAQYDIACDLKSGYLDVAIKGRHLRAMEAAHLEMLERNFPFEHRLLSREETRDTIGTDAYIGAHLNMANGHLHPLNLCLGEARAAADLGVRIYENSAVQQVQDGPIATVRTADGAVRAKFVVLAGNAYQTFAPALRSRFFPVRSYIMATASLSSDQVQKFNPLDLAVCDPNFVLEYFRLSADKRLLFGGRCRGFHEDPAEIQAQLRPRMQRIYPALADVQIDYAWGGTIAVPMNRVPQMGRTADNVFYANAYSGHGVNVTHLAGEILADVIAGTAERFDVFSRFKSMRIPGVTKLGQTMVSLGMIYYGMKDRL